MYLSLGMSNVSLSQIVIKITVCVCVYACVYMYMMTSFWKNSAISIILL